MDKTTPHSPAAGADSALSRRKLFAGAGTAGALAAAAALLPRSEPAPAVVAGDTPAAQPDGYRLSEHIKRYYQTARI